MFRMDDDNTLHLTRGDICEFPVMHIFAAGDVVRFKVMKKKDCNTIMLQRDFVCESGADAFVISLSGDDTKIGEVISKPTDYWYEVELNPDTNPQTIIGYDEDGPKVFKLFPEGKDVDGDDVEVVGTKTLQELVDYALKQAKESGEFDGKDGVDGKDGEDGADGKDGANGADGKDGTDGVSCTHSWNGTILTITSASGTSSADLKGADGEGGVGGTLEIGLEKGEAEGSIQQEGAKALGPKTIALGTSIAGCKGYYYSAIHLVSKCILLSETQVEPVILEANPYGYHDQSFSCEWQVGDKISIVNGAHYDEQLTIREIDGNFIFVAESIPFDEIQTGDTGLDAYSVCVPSRPECGVINLGEGAFAAGTDVKATGRFSSSFGRNNRSFGDYSFTAGRNNEASYASSALGWLCKALGQYSVVAGRDNISTGNNSTTLGFGLTNPYENAFICGFNNDPTIADLLLGIGYGFDGVAKNAFNIDIYGNVWVDKDPTMPMGVATKQYTDTIKNDLEDFREYVSEKANLEREVITIDAPANLSMSPNKYYVITTSGEQISFTNMTLNEPTNSDIVNEYKLRINNLGGINFYASDGTLASIKGLPESYDASKTYEISIIDGYAKYTTLGETATSQSLGGTLIVTATTDESGNMTASHTVAEILAAVNEGKCVYANDGGLMLPCVIAEEEWGAAFSVTMALGEEAVAITMMISPDGTVSLTEKQLSPATALSDEVYAEIDTRISNALGDVGTVLDEINGEEV